MWKEITARHLRVLGPAWRIGDPVGSLNMPNAVWQGNDPNSFLRVSKTADEWILVNCERRGNVIFATNGMSFTSLKRLVEHLNS